MSNPFENITYYSDTRPKHYRITWYPVDRFSVAVYLLTCVWYGVIIS